MAVRTKLLVPPTNLAVTTSTLLYTCPAGETAIVKTITEVNGNASSRWYSMTLSVSGADVPIIWRRLVPAASSAQLLTWIVVPAGEVLKVTNELATAITLSISGTELEGVAD